MRREQGWFFLEFFLLIVQFLLFFFSVGIHRPFSDIDALSLYFFEEKIYLNLSNIV